MSDRSEELVGDLGVPSPTLILSPAQLDAMAGHLPDDLIRFLARQGAGMWKQGKFQFCLPEKFASVCQRIFADDSRLRPEETHIVGFSAFGELLAWNEKFERVLVALPSLELRVPAIEDPEALGSCHLATPLFRLAAREGAFNFIEDTDEADYLFDRARKRLGQLELGQCYGFVPALGLGGRARLENLERLDALARFSMLADLGTLRMA